MEKRLSKSAVALSLAMFLLGGVAGFFVGYPVGKTAGLDPLPMAEAEDGLFFSGGQENGISMTAATIVAESYDEYDIMPTALAAKQLTATVTPADAEDAVIDWSVAWKSGASGQWGYNKTVTDYVTVTPTANGAKTANVQCLQAFGEQIIVTAAIRGNTSVKGTATLGYEEKVLYAGWTAQGARGQDFDIYAYNQDVYSDKENSFTFTELDFTTYSVVCDGVLSLTASPAYTTGLSYPVSDSTYDFLKKIKLEANPTFFKNYKQFVNSYCKDLLQRDPIFNSAIQGIPDDGIGIVVECAFSDFNKATDLSCVPFMFGTFFSSMRNLTDFSTLQVSLRQFYSYGTATTPIFYVTFGFYRFFSEKVAIYYAESALE